MRPFFLNAFIDLEAIGRNFKAMQQVVGENVECAAVVKANAYGLGDSTVSEKLYDIGCRNFWVAYSMEAERIRKVLPLDAKIYFLHGFQEFDINLFKNQGIIPVINSIDEFSIIKKKGINFVLHVDTGLSRIGLSEHDLDCILCDLKTEKIDYVISHFACSDEKFNKLNDIQKEKFDRILHKIRSIVDVKSSVSASCSTLLDRKYHYDAVRIGAFLYGIKSGKCPIPENVFSLKAKVLQTYEIEPGTSVGYGATFIAKRKTKISVVSIGYADGLKRSLANKGCVLFYDDSDRHYKAPIIGNISMDLTACDVTAVPENLTIHHADATILSKDYSINDMAIDASTIPYEILTSFSHSQHTGQYE
ncbi:alanine racemase [Alphaproteobacteria bacterium]|nr:alanine racemase [Alphaproteobacteria bacterium]